MERQKAEHLLHLDFGRHRGGGLRVGFIRAACGAIGVQLSEARDR